MFKGTWGSYFCNNSKCLRPLEQKNDLEPHIYIRQVIVWCSNSLACAMHLFNSALIKDLLEYCQSVFGKRRIKRCTFILCCTHHHSCRPRIEIPYIYPIVEKSEFSLLSILIFDYMRASIKCDFIYLVPVFLLVTDNLTSSGD